ncbi:hypothetical protein [Leptolyngbya iicbica]|uniref:Uncharacterized protein n=2 Tax=Cyanophyceae TaxID=3028117 RepID=A0A4Q7EFT2_9CYAN|nr:hypothetical protein [Leptolyngbya sp. LK]RZM82113.1 hypothetical protein DYY88_02315 [Leptolyngbya sp. LK]
MDQGVGDFTARNQAWLLEQAGFGLVDQEAVRPTTAAESTLTTGVTAARGAQTLSLTRGVLPESQRVNRTSHSLEVSHASPLAPLRARDREALDDFFERDDVSDIALDIHRYLSRMYPEPCWEDEPYEFLKGFI